MFWPFKKKRTNKGLGQFTKLGDDLHGADGPRYHTYRNEYFASVLKISMAAKKSKKKNPKTEFFKALRSKYLARVLADKGPFRYNQIRLLYLRRAHQELLALEEK